MNHARITRDMYMFALQDESLRPSVPLRLKATYMTLVFYIVNVLRISIVPIEKLVGQEVAYTL
jgi:hypothetical protein